MIAEQITRVGFPNCLENECELSQAGRELRPPCLSRILGIIQAPDQ
ncbi:hypothetical protein Sinac_2089 [Singulisphaera acidiphila DSM 18658]|uniref:Uncharacterized protein n=1 Tax=Singulisphaera acidiphila (strain ATCC BAA-1392 / DSM 18658 / VKM B-2454 / MOB10) TaxID=886293 RepID=L0DAM8_SINAD|nr:hypothetical protein Sinac_2089 [Singulisphaera acidiphila DSM 18658]